MPDPGAITFDELGLGVTIANEYVDQGVVFTSNVFTTTDQSNPTSPVLAGTPRFFGDIAARFTVPGATTPTTVDGFSFDVGFIDDRNSVEIQYFDAGGALVGSTRAQSYGINRIDIAYRGVASFTVKAVEFEAAGFAIDNLVIHRMAVGAQPTRMAEFGDSYSSGEGLVPEKGLRYDCGTDLHKGLYVEGTTQFPTQFAFWEKGSCQTATGSTDRPRDLAKRGAVEYENLCHRHGRAYPNQIRERLGVQPANSIFVACSGARTVNVGTGSVSKAQHPKSPPGVHGGQTQLENVKEFAGGGAPELITIGIGGNDAGFVGIIEECIFHTCTEPDFAARTVSTINGTMFSNVRDTFKGLRTALPGSTIVAFGYPSVVDDPARECGRAFRIGADELAWIKGTVLPTVNDAIKDAAAEAGVSYVDITATTAGHGVCSDEPWINGLRGGDDNFGIGNESFHPTQKAHDAIASFFIDHYTDGAGHLLVKNPDPSPPIRPATGPEIRLGSIDAGAAQQCGADCLQPAACVQACDIHVQGHGFDPGVAMGVTIQSDPINVGQVIADPNGDVNARFRLPKGIEPGLHSVTLDGLATDGTREHAVRGFRVFSRVSSKITAKFKAGKNGTAVRVLAVKPMPPGTRVDIACAKGRRGVETVFAIGHVKRRGGCPFAHRIFRAGESKGGHGKAKQRSALARRKGGGKRRAGLFAPYFKSPLRAGTVVRVVVSRRGQAGRALDVRIRAGKKPKLTRRCTEPGLRELAPC